MGLNFALELKQHRMCVWKIQQEGTCREVNTVQGKAECCICLETPTQLLYFSYTQNCKKLRCAWEAKNVTIYTPCGKMCLLQHCLVCQTHFVCVFECIWHTPLFTVKERCFKWYSTSWSSFTLQFLEYRNSCDKAISKCSYLCSISSCRDDF